MVSDTVTATGGSQANLDAIEQTTKELRAVLTGLASAKDLSAQAQELTQNALETAQGAGPFNYDALAELEEYADALNSFVDGVEEFLNRYGIG